MHGRTMLPALFMSDRSNGEGTRSSCDEANGGNKEGGIDEGASDEGGKNEGAGGEGGNNEGANGEGAKASERATTFENELMIAAALWILKIKESYKSTQSAMDEIIHGVTDFNKYVLSKLYSVI